MEGVEKREPFYTVGGNIKSNYLKDMRLFFFFLSFRATPESYGGSQARGLISTVAASLRHSHRNAGSEPYLQPTPQLMAMPDP